MDNKVKELKEKFKNMNSKEREEVLKNIINFCSYKIKIVKRDGILIKKFQCPLCEVFGEIDNDQFHGRISILCDCGFHETIDLAKEKFVNYEETK